MAKLQSGKVVHCGAIDYNYRGKYMRLPVLSGEDVVKLLGKAGYRPVRQRGSHKVVQKIEGSVTKTVVVPMHNELAKGTLRAIIRQAGLTVDEFIELVSE